MRDNTHIGALETDTSADTGFVEPPAAPEGSRARRIAFRILSVLVSLSLLVLMVFSLMEVVLMWLPWDTLMSFIDDLPAGDEIHRAHFNMIGIVSWALVACVVVQLRRPERRVAAMLAAAGIVITGMLVYGLSGTLSEWLIEDVLPVIFVVGLAILHPRARDMLRRPNLDRPMAMLVAAAAVPWIVFAVDHALTQFRDAAGDPHAQVEHWATAALMAVTIIWFALIGSSDHPGWRLPAWVAALASIEYGVHSLVFPDVASSASSLWAVATVVWGVAFAAGTVRRTLFDRRPVPAA